MGLFGAAIDVAAADADYEAGLDRCRRAAPLAARAGCVRAYNHIWPGHNERDYAENFAFHRERLKRLAGVLAPLGITFGLEFLGPKTIRDRFTKPFLYRLEQAVELIEAVGDGVGVVLDLYHWHCSGGTVADLRQWLPQARLVNVHANDAIAGVDRDQQLDKTRAMPLETGVIDALGAVRVLKGLAYDGPIIAEPFQPHRDRFAAMAPDAVAAEVAASLRRLVESA